MRTRWAVVVAAALFLFVSACKKQDLAHRVQAKLASAMPGVTIDIVDDSTLRVKRSGGAEETLSLDNLRLICTNDARNCDGAIDRLVTNTAALKGEAPPLDRKAVRAVLKSREAIETVRALVAKTPPDKRAGNEPCTEPFGGDLFVFLVNDMPDGMAMLRHSDLETLGLDPTQARALAQTNLKAALTAVPTEPAGAGVLRVRAGDDYEAARLLLPELWDDIARRVQGDLLVIASNRHTVFAAGSKDPAAVARMKELAEKSFAKDGYPLSTTVFRRTEKGFVPASTGS